MNGLAADFFELSLALQIALGSGYLAYMTAYAGLRRDHHGADQVAISLVFSGIALAIANACQELPGLILVAITLISTTILAVIWRKLGRPVWHWGLKSLKIHREDGTHTGWAAMVQTDFSVTQATIYLKNGEVLFLEDRTKYKGAPWQGLYLCGDGSISMIVDEVTNVDGIETRKSDTFDPDWGARISHIPADQIVRVDFRMK